MVRRYSAKHSAAAYTLVDLSDLDDDLRKDIVEDATAGGGLYGIRVVEESVNGGARSPIFGVYKDGPDADRWTQAKKDLEITGTTVDDSEAYAGTGIEVTDPLRAAALREAAAQKADALADSIRAGENDALAAITGDTDEEATDVRNRDRGRRVGGDHPQNIVDTGLDTDATNEVADAEDQEAPKASKTKTPK